MTARNRYWCLTSFAETEPEFCKPMRYMVYQREKCPDTQKLHWQIYCEFSRQVRLNQVKSLFGSKVHAEVAKNRKKAREYCMKEESRVSSPVEHGEWTLIAQGKRTDIQEFVNDIKQGYNDYELALKHGSVMLKYPNGFRMYKSIIQKHNSMAHREIKVKVYWGESGAGKTKSALEESFDFYMPDLNGSSNTVWFTNYDGERVLIIDDFNCQIKLHLLYRWLDRYPLQLQTKGGNVYAQWSTVIITALKHPDDWYPNHCMIEERKALMRRIHEIKYFKRIDVHCPEDPASLTLDPLVPYEQLPEHMLVPAYNQEIILEDVFNLEQFE